MPKKLSSRVHLKPATIKGIDKIGNLFGDAVAKSTGVPGLQYLNPYHSGRVVGENYVGPALIKAGLGVKPKKTRKPRKSSGEESKDIVHSEGAIRDKPKYNDPRDPAGIITFNAATNKRIARERAADPIYFAKDFTYRPTPVPGFSQFD